MNNKTIEIGDTVSVHFYHSQFTLCEKAIVHRRPAGAGDSWIFEDAETGTVHYVSEGCTITKTEEEER